MFKFVRLSILARRPLAPLFLVLLALACSEPALAADGKATGLQAFWQWTGLPGLLGW